MMQPRNLGRDFNPLKFDFAPATMRNFNPLKFDFELVGPQETEMDILEMLPESLGPETQLFLPRMGITSHQDVTLNGHDNVNERGYYQQSRPATPVLDTETLNLLDSLEMKFASSSATPPERRASLNMSQMVDDILHQHHRLPQVQSALDDKSNIMDVENTQGLTPEQIRVMRNKAVQKRYRIRKKNESQNKSDKFSNTQRSLMLAESKSPQHHIEIVDKLLRLRKMNSDRDAEIKRLRKMLATEKTSKQVAENQVMVIDSGLAKEGDYCDEKMEVYVSREKVVDLYANACCEKMMATSSCVVKKALASSTHTMSSLFER